MQDAQLAVWITLLAVPGIGLVIANRLYALVNDWSAASSLSVDDWMRFQVTRAMAEEIAKTFSNNSAWEQIKLVREQGIGVMMIHDHDYPPLLRHIHLPPVALFYLGERPRVNPGVAVVGTRKATSYGIKVAKDLAAYLSQYDVPIVSGLALGIDAAAHKGALIANGYTIAVLGSGVSRIYPSANQRLASEILSAGGTIISEYLPHTQPHRAYFPVRNRIISGLAKALVVVEAGKRSGAHITAAYAVQQNRDVYAVPGSIYSTVSQGTNELLMDGAIPLYSFAYLAENLGLLPIQNASTADDREVEDEWEQRICAELALGVKSLMELHTLLGMLNVTELGIRLGELELEGKVRRSADGRYTLA